MLPWNCVEERLNWAWMCTQWWAHTVPHCTHPLDPPWQGVQHGLEVVIVTMHLGAQHFDAHDVGWKGSVKQSHVRLRHKSTSLHIDCWEVLLTCNNDTKIQQQADSIRWMYMIAILSWPDFSIPTLSVFTELWLDFIECDWHFGPAELSAWWCSATYEMPAKT